MSEPVKNFQIAIDGYSSCGKSSVSKKLAERLGLFYIDSGAMYRAFAYHLLTKQKEICEAAAVDSLSDFRLEIHNNRTENIIILNQEDISASIRNNRISQAASQVAQYKDIRQHLVSMQQELGSNNRVIMDGRDIGTVVFPAAEIKIFLTATRTVRAARRHKELSDKGIQITLEEVKRSLEERDRRDSTRTESPLIQADDAILVDTTNLSLEESIVMIEVLIRHRMHL